MSKYGMPYLLQVHHFPIAYEVAEYRRTGYIYHDVEREVAERNVGL